MIYILYYASLQDMSIYKMEYKIELPNDSLAKNINIGDKVFGTVVDDDDDDEAFPYIVKHKNYFPIKDEIYLFVYRV
jgi:hypothetical protein